MNKVEFYEHGKINGKDAVQKKDVKILKCELDGVVYFKYNTNHFCAYDLNSGLVIQDNVKRLTELKEKVNGLKNRILEIRNGRSYIKLVEKHNECIRRYEVEE